LGHLNRAFAEDAIKNYNTNLDHRAIDSFLEKYGSHSDPSKFKDSPFAEYFDSPTMGEDGKTNFQRNPSASIAFLNAKAGSNAYDGLDPRAISEGLLSFNSETNLITYDKNPPVHFSPSELSYELITEINGTFPELENNDNNDFTPFDGSFQFRTPDNNYIGFGRGTLTNFRRSTIAGYDTIEIGTDTDSATIVPFEPIQSGEVTVGFDPFEAYINENTNLDLIYDDTTFSTRPQDEPLSTSIFDDPALVSCELHNILAEIYMRPEILCDEQDPVFQDQDYEALAEVAMRKTAMAASDDIQLGKDYLKRIVDTAQEGTPLNLNEEKHKLKENQEAVLVMNELEDLSQREQYAKINFKDQGYTAENNMFIRTPNYIIIIHSGNVTKTENKIEAEHATIFWNLESYNEDYSEITSKNIVTGKWNATLFQDNVTDVALTPSIMGYAQLRNFDADVHMKTYGNVNIDYLPEGSITHVQPRGPRISEIEYGEEFEGGGLVFYQRGTLWDLFFTSDIFSADDYLDDFYVLRNGQSVINTTIYSKDSHVLYKPEVYKIGTFSNTSAKTVCYIDCEAEPNVVKVMSVDDNLISVGQLGNMSVTYDDHFTNVYDLHLYTLSKLDTNDLVGSFSTLEPQSTQDEEELLTRSSLEAHMPLNRRESLEQHNQLFYQYAKPASYALFGSKVWIDGSSYVDLKFLSYQIDGQRKLVLDEYSYNNALALRLQNSGFMRVSTEGLFENAIVYSVNRDLFMQPIVYGNIITFDTLENTRNKFGTILEVNS